MEEDKKQAIIQAASNVSLCPIPIEDDVIVKYKRSEFNILDIGELGMGFESVKNALTGFFSSNQSGTYKVTFPKGGHLAEAKDGSGLLGTVLDNKDNTIMAQARLEDATEIACDPAMLFVAVALVNIEMKLNDIQETQEEILDLLVQKEKAELKGNLKFLTDEIEKYKYNWNNKQYKDANYIKALDIRQKAEQSIVLARTNIKKELGKKELINTDQTVSKQLEKLKSGMEDYQLAVYLLGLSYYAEILFQGNFDAGYLESIEDKIDQYSIEYREMYSAVYDKLEKDKGAALQGVLMKGIGKAGKGLGDVVGKVPLLQKGPVDEMLKKAGKQISKQRNEDEKNDLSGLLPQHNCNVKPFIDTLDMIDKMYNKPVVLAFDKNKVYLLDENTEGCA